MFRTFLFAICALVHFKTLAQTCSIISSDIVCREELISFDVSANPGVQSVLWDMGDGTTTTQKSFSHKYSTKGVKTVSVTVDLTGGGTCVASKKITVYGLPEFKISKRADNTYCLWQNKICIVDSSNGGDSGVKLKKRIIIWDDGNQDVSNSPGLGDIICHSYGKTGTFKVTIELTNDKDCKSKMEMDIEILPDVVPKINLYSPDNNILRFCDSARTDFEDLTVKDTANVTDRIYDWGDGVKIKTNKKRVSHFYKQSGFYKVSLSYVQKNGCVTTKDTVIEVIVYEVKFKIIKNAYRQCIGEVFRIQQIDNYDGWYGWSINDTSIGYDRNLKFVDISPFLGKKKISLYIYNQGCSRIFKYDSIEVIGTSTSIKVLNEFQCEKKDTVYFKIVMKKYGIGKLSYFMDFGDDSAAQCTTSLVKGININSNCNFTTDSIGKHFYVNGVCRVWNITIKDMEFGCAERTHTSFINLVKPERKDYKFHFNNERPCIGNKLGYLFRFGHQLCNGAVVKTNLDSACGKKLFSPRLISEYAYPSTCNKDGWVTVGFAIKFGSPVVYTGYNDTADFYVDTNRLCYDTVWFHNWFRLLTDPVSEYKAAANCISSAVKPVLTNPIQNKITFSKWDWGDSTQIDSLPVLKGDSIMPQASHRYKKAGKYTISHYIENEGRCYDFDTINLGIGFNMKVHYDAVICPRSPVKFFDSISYGFEPDTFRYNWFRANRKQAGLETFKWDFDDGRGFVTDTSRPVISFPRPGIYTVRLAAKDSLNCFDTLILPVHVGSVHAGIKAVNKKIICDDILQLFDSSYSDYKPPADSISVNYWDFGDLGNPSYVKDPYHFYKTFGDYTIFHRVENSRGCKDSVTIKIKIEGPIAKFDIVSDTIGCAPFTAEFKNQSQKAKDFIWYFGDPLKSKLSTKRDTNVRFTYTKPGIYYVYLFGSDSVVNPDAGNAVYYCKSFFPDTTLPNHLVRKIIVLPSYKSDFTVNPVQCKNKPIVVTDNSDSVFKRFKWVIPNIDSIETVNKTGVLYSKDTGSFSVKFFPWYPPTGAYDRACLDTIIKTIKVTEIVADFDILMDTTACPVFKFTNTTKGSKAIKWDLGDLKADSTVNIRNDSSFNYTYTSGKGTFIPCLFVENFDGCRDTICKTIDVDFVVKLIIPNVFTPNNDGLNDVFDIDAEGLEEYDLYIFNRWGQQVFHSGIDGIGNDGFNWTGRNHAYGFYPEGTYFYIFKYKFGCDEKGHRTQGTVTLLDARE